MLVAQHNRGPWRLTAVEIEPRNLVADVTRTAAMLLVAVFLILVLLPALLEASTR